MITSPTFSQFHSGRLLSIKPDLYSASGGQYTRVLLQVESEAGGQHVHSWISVPLIALRKPEFLGPVIGQESYDRLKNGQDLDPFVLRSIGSLKNIQVEVELEPTRRTFYYGSQDTPGLADMQGKDVRVRQILNEPSSKTEPLSTPGVGRAADWPDAPETPPFTPIPVPFSRVDSMLGKTRIGYAILDTPIHALSMTRDTRVESKAAIRQQGTMKRHQGFAYASYTLNWVVQGPEEIYHGVQEVYEQFAQCPFLTADGGPFGHPGESGQIPKAIALRSFTINTVDNLPNALEVSLSLDPFIWSFYIQPSWGEYKILEMDDAVCWPLVKLWCKSRTRSQFHGQEFNGRFALRFPSTELTDQLRRLSADQHAGEETIQDVAMLRTTLTGLIGGSEGFINSRNAKLIRHPSIQDPTRTKIVALKFEDAKLFQELTGLGSTGAGGGNPAHAGLIVGLMDWYKRLAYHNYSSSDGQFLPQSAYVTDTFLQRSLDNNTLQNISVGGIDMQLADVVFGVQNVSGRIQQLVDAEINQLQTSSINYQSELARLQAERTDRVQNPHQYYAVLMVITPQNHEKAVSLLTNLIAKYDDKVAVKYQSLKNVHQLFTQSSFDTEAPGLVIETGTQNPEILVERISASRNHNLAVTSFRGNPLPLHQHVGGMDTVLVVEGKCFSDSALAQINLVKEEFDRRNLNRASRKFVIDAGGEKKAREIVTSFMYVDNEIFHLLGVFFAMPINLSVESIPEQPGVWHWSISFVEYDPTQFLQEEIRFMNTYMNQLGRAYHQGFDDKAENPLLQRAEEYLSLQDALRDEEVYPDLRLPTRSEFEGWITICRRLAKDYQSAKDKTQFLERGVLKGNTKSQTLAPYELEVLKHVRQFFEGSALEMVKWQDFTGQGRPGTVVSRYMDPDFFIYYNSDSSWGSVFDGVTNHIMGPPDDQNRATGHPQSTDDGRYPQGSIRFTDPNLAGVTSVSDPNYFAVIDNQIGDQLNQLDKNSFLPFAASQTELEEYRKKIEEQVQATDNRKRWWPSSNSYTISVSAPGDPSSLQLSPEQAAAFANGLLDDRARNFQESLQFVQGTGKTGAVLTDSELAEGSAIDAFLSLGWRQEKAFEIAAHGSSNPKPTNRDLSQHSGEFWLSNLKEVLQTKVGSQMGPGILAEGDTLEKQDLDEAFRLWYQEGATDHSGTIPNTQLSKARFILMQGGGFKTDGKDFATTTWRVNQNFQAAQIRDVTVSYGQFEDNLAGSWDFIDAYCRTKGNVDPHIIRAILIRHDGLGAFQSQASGEDIGFGDFHPLFISGGTPTERTRQLIDRFSDHMRKFNNVPSIALTALTMEMRSEMRTLYLDADGKIPAGNMEKMQAASAAVATHRFSRQGVSDIQSLILKFPRIADQVDGYYATYINLCRSHGSYLLGSDHSKQSTLALSDPLFFGFGGMMLGDLGDNRQKYVDTSFTPSGKTVAAPLDRDRVLPYLANIYRYQFDQKFKPDQSSYEAQLRLSTKLHAAMDPHSEAAIYGSLVDLRTHSAFGRLVGAFPSYSILLINEGFYVGNTKLWDQHYARAGVAEIEVFKSRKEPASVCNIVLSNMFYNLSAYAQMEALQQQVAVANNRKMGEFTKGGRAFSFKTLNLFLEVFLRKMPKELIKIWQSNHLKQLALGVGTRLHVRMGYGANASQLPVVFNGTVMNVPAEEGYIQLRAVGDGYELDKPTTTSLVQAGDAFAFQDGGALGVGKDPSSILSEALIGANLAENLTQGLFRDFTKGVVHFGEVYFEGVRHYATETQINIYSSKNSRLEQQLPMIQNYFNVSALYNYDQSNLFSVSVKEPTLWKIMEVCRRACIDFVASPETFTTRSTVFFGKWWWPYNYDYHESILGLSGNIRNKFQGVPKDWQTQYDSPNATTPDLTPDTTKLQTSGNIIKTWFGVEAEESCPQAIKDKVASMREPGMSLPGDPILRIVRLDLTDDELYYATLSDDRVLKCRAKETQVTITGHETLGELQAKLRAQERGEDRFEFEEPKKTDSTDTIFGFDYLRDIEVYTQFLKYKTYTQAYIAHSMINLLENKIETSKDLVYTDAVGVHKYNGVFSPESLVHTIRYSVDSVAGYTPITVRHPDKSIDILPIEDLFSELRDTDEKQYVIHPKLEVLDRNGWTTIKAAMAHRTRKTLWSVNCHSGLVDVTDDHSLITDRGELLTAQQAAGQKLITVSTPPSTSEYKDFSADEAYALGAFVAEGSAGHYVREIEVRDTWAKNHKVALGKKYKTASYQFKIVQKPGGRLDLEQVLRGLSSMGFPCKILKYKSENLQQVVLDTGQARTGLTKQSITQWFIDECYTGRKEKRIPKAILNSPPEIQEAFLRGYYAGDGTAARTSLREFNSWTTDSMVLAQGLSYLVNRVTGLRTVVVVSTKLRASGPVDYYVVRSVRDDGRGHTWKKEAGVVKSVNTCSRQEGTVYDLHTDSNTFCAGINNVLVHNTDIQPQDRRQMVVDTGLVLTTIQSGIKALAEGLLTGLSYVPIFGALVAGEGKDFIQQTPTTPAVENGVVSALVDSVKEMYQGWFVITGQTTMKPRDLVLLNDHHLTMRGPVFVKEVTHRFDSQNGLITIVSPDCVVYPHGSEFGHQLVMSLSVGALHKIGGFYLMRAAAAQTLGEFNHWLKYRAQKNLAGPLGKYMRLADSDSVTSLRGQSAEILKGYKERINARLGAEAKALHQLESSSPAAIEAHKQLAAKMQALEELQDVEQIQEFARTNGMPDLAPEDLKYVTGSEAKQKLLLQEMKWAEEEREDIRVAQKVLGQSREEAEATARAHLNRKRAAWASANEQDVDRALFEAAREKGKVPEALLKEFEEATARKASNIKTLQALEALEKTTEEQTKEILALRQKIAADNRLLARYTDQFIASNAEIDNLVREAAKGVKYGGFQAWIKRIVDGTFGGTAAAGDAAVTAAERLAIERAKSAEKTAKAGRPVSTLRRHLAELQAFIKESKGLSAADNALRVGNKLKNGFQFAKDLYRGGTLISYAGPQALLKVVYDVAVLVIGGQIVDGINARWKARQCVKIVPLIVGDPGYPLTAGIRGHQGAVIGDDPSWADTLLYGWMKVGDGEDHYTGQNIMTFVASMLGVQVPDYLPTEQDKQFLQDLENEGQDTEAAGG